ncbi:MAG: 3'-5' exoribonuclease YhaM [Isosphaeraceae bacterium]
MASIDTAVVRLSDLEPNQEAICFAALVKKERGITKENHPFIKCHFRDKRRTLVAPFWAGNALQAEAATWSEGCGYRLRVRTTWKVQYGLQLDVLEGRAAGTADAHEGYDFFDLVESSEQDPEVLFEKIQAIIEKCIDEPHLKELVQTLLRDNAELFKKMPAAQTFHHSYTAGLIEHVWSMTRIASWLGDHYARYYHDLNPPLNKEVILAATVLHDIGKLRELDYHPVESKDTTEGCLIGHVLIGRDLVREAAGKIEGFPRETLLLLEHAILSHHGRRDYGAPIVPQTVEALLVSFIDDLDAKMNIAARNRLQCNTDGEFTDKVYALDNRRFYKGIPRETPRDDEGPDLP